LIVFGLSHTWQGFVRVYPLSNDPKLKGIARCEQWTHGYVHVGTVENNSIKYVTGYVTNKLTGAPETALYGQREKPFQRASQALGERFVNQHKAELMSTGSIGSQSVLMRLPRYYKKKLDIKNYTISKVLEGRTLLAETLMRATLIHRCGTPDPQMIEKEIQIIREQRSKNSKAKQQQKTARRKT